MLDVHRLRLLRELDRRGTLAAVARALSYSPSAISQQLSQLEAETGVTLLEPVGRGVRLTPLARILVTHTEAILERLEEAEADLRASATEVRGTLRVASFQSVLFALIPSVLTRLAERHPGLRLEITRQEAVARRSRSAARPRLRRRARRGVPGFAPAPRRCRVPALSCWRETSCSWWSRLTSTVPPPGPRRRRATSTRPTSLIWLVPGSSTRRPPRRGQWARDACRAAGFEPDVPVMRGLTCCCRSTSAEEGHVHAASDPRPAARRRPAARGPRPRPAWPPSAPQAHFTGVRSGRGRRPRRYRAFRAALPQQIGLTAAIGSTAANGRADVLCCCWRLLPAMSPPARPPLLGAWLRPGRRRACRRRIPTPTHPTPTSIAGDGRPSAASTRPAAPRGLGGREGRPPRWPAPSTAATPRGCAAARADRTVEPCRVCCPAASGSSRGTGWSSPAPRGLSGPPSPGHCGPGARTSSQ